MGITRFNKEIVKFEFEPSREFTFRTLEELYKENGKEEVYPVKGMFINTKGRYGDNPVLVCSEYYVSLPSHLVDVVKEIRQDKQLVKDINDDKVGFKIYEYTHPKYNRKCYSITWLDI